MEDVMNVTKVYNNTHMVWPKPDVRHILAQRAVNPIVSPNNDGQHVPFGSSSLRSRFSDVQSHPNPAGLGMHGMPTQNVQPQPVVDFNPWNQPPPIVVPNNVSVK